VLERQLLYATTPAFRFHGHLWHENLTLTAILAAHATSMLSSTEYSIDANSDHFGSLCSDNYYDVESRR